MTLHRTPGSTDDDGLLVGRYRLVSPLGQGAFGTVWRAHDERLRREVAVKVLPRDGLDEARFVREARAAARLHHPGVVTLYEAAADHDGAYLVSELVQGTTLSRLLAEGRAAEGQLAEIGLALLDALGHAHAQGVVHRDIKPANILVPDRPQSAAGMAKLTDFGVASLFEDGTLTATGEVLGTAAYMAPEQAMGREAGPPADVYALALVICEALTGINPLRERGGADPRRGWVRLGSTRRMRPDLPRELCDALDRALEPRPEDRAGSGELRAALAHALPSLSEGRQSELHRGRVPAPATRVRPEPLWPEPPLPEHPLREPLRHESPGPDPDAAPELLAPPARRRPLSVASTPAALTLVGAVAWMIPHLARTSRPGEILPALGAGALFLFLPRLAWILAAGGLVVLAATGNHPGAALWLAAAAVAPAALLPLRPRTWPLPLLTAAAALGGAGFLAGCWPALAGRSRGPLTRAGLGACGWFLLVAALAWHGRRTGYLPVPHDLAAHRVWTHSLMRAKEGMLIPLARSGLLLGAPVWALSAMALPWLVRGRSLVVDAVTAVIWTAVTVAGAGSAVGAAGQAASFAASDPAVIGAVLAALAALAPAFMGAWRGEGAGRGLP